MLEGTEFEDCSIRESLWRQVWIRRAYDRDQRVGDYANLPRYFGVPSHDGKHIHIAKHGIGAINITLIAETIPLEIKDVLGVLK